MRIHSITRTVRSRKFRLRTFKVLNAIVATMTVFNVSLLGTFLVPSIADAARVGTSATVNGSATVTVAQGATVSVAFTVTTTGTGTDNDWQSTSYRIGNSGNYTCVNTANYTNAGTYTETFNVTAPSTPGSYALNLRAYSDDGSSSGCDDGQSTTLTVNNAIVISDNLTVTAATVNGAATTNVLPSAIVDVDVNVTTQGSGDNNDWESTRYMIEGGNWICVNHGDHETSGSYAESFNVTAPVGTGTYDLSVRAYNNDTCNSNESSSIFTLQDAIAVANPATTINAWKLVCANETDLPNWGNGGPNVTATTAQDWIASHPGCGFASDWSFQWAPANTANPGDNTGAAGAPWTTFGPTNVNGKATASIANIGNNDHLWVREIWNDAYIPFNGQLTPVTNDVSATIYCSTDVLNYDNYDRIDDVQQGGTYNCVAWNVAAPAPTGSVHGQKFNDANGNGQWDEEAGAQLADWTIFIDENANATLDANEVSTTTSNVAGPDYGWYHFTDLPYGTYSICEVQKAGWELTFPTSVNGCHTVTVPTINYQTDTCYADQQNTLLCDFGNHLIPPGNIIVHKQVNTDPNAAGYEVTNDADANTLGFRWQVNGGTDLMFGDSATVPAGTYTISESMPNSDYYFWGSVVGSEVSCANSELNTEDSTPVVEVAAGQTVHLTFCNIRSHYAVQVSKVVEPLVGEPTTLTSADAWTWSTDDNFGGTYTGKSGDVRSLVDNIDHVITESATDYPADMYTSEWTCRLGETVVGTGNSRAFSIDTDWTTQPVSGQTYGCTFTNTEIQPSVDIEKFVDKATANPGDTLTYTITVTNSSGNTASGIRVDDTLPSFVGAPTNVTPAATSTSEGHIIWDNLIVPGNSFITLTFKAVVNSNLPVGTTLITNTATLSNTPIIADTIFSATAFTAQATPVYSGSSTVTTTVTVAPPTPQVLGAATAPKLTIEKSADMETAKPGDVVSYTIAVKNIGDGDAENVVVTDTLPDDLSFVEGSGKTRTWNLGSIAPGETGTVVVDVRIESDAVKGEYVNVASVVADDLDPVQASATITVETGKVLGLATTGSSAADYALFMVGTFLAAFGLIGLAMRRTVPVKARK